MLLVLSQYWGWLVLVGFIGILTGVLTSTKSPVGPVFPGWLGWVLSLFAFGVVAAWVRWFDGQAGTFLETGLLSAVSYVAGAGIGSIYTNGSPRPQKAWWGGFVISGLIWLASSAIAVGPIEAAVKARAAEAMKAAGGDPDYMDVAGRDALLALGAGDVAKRAALAQALDETDGVRRVTEVAETATSVKALAAKATAEKNAADKAAADKAAADAAAAEKAAAEKASAEKAAANKVAMEKAAAAKASAEKAAADKAAADKAASDKATSAKAAADKAAAEKAAAEKAAADKAAAEKAAAEKAAADGMAAAKAALSGDTTGVKSAADLAAQKAASVAASKALPETGALTPKQCQVALAGLVASEKIVFASASANVSAGSKGLLTKIAAVLARCPEAKIQIEGHTDSAGNTARNFALSEKRANAVVDELVQLGASKAGLTAVGFGEDRPIASNDTDEGKAENRRIDFVVQP